MVSPKTQPKPAKAKKKVYSGNFCCAPGCANQSGKDKFLGISRKYHRIPWNSEGVHGCGQYHGRLGHRRRMLAFAPIILLEVG